MHQQLLAALERLTPIPLTQENLERVDTRPGVYRLYLQAFPVYVGKADGSLRSRIDKHRRKVSGRLASQESDIPLAASMSFSCLYIDEDLHALAPERMLITSYKKTGEADWNFNGFGNNDPGKERDTSRVKEDHFDRLHPINLDHPVTMNSSRQAGWVSLRELMNSIKDEAPFTFRFQNNKTAEGRLLDVERQDLAQYVGLSKTVHEWFAIIAAKLPDGWSIVVFPGYVIAYGERNVAQFPSRQGSWLAGSSAYTEHFPEWDSGETKAAQGQSAGQITGVDYSVASAVLTNIDGQDDANTQQEGQPPRVESFGPKSSL